MLRTACRDEELELTARVQLLQLVELRAAGWHQSDNMTSYYRQKLASALETQVQVLCRHYIG